MREELDVAVGTGDRRRDDRAHAEPGSSRPATTSLDDRAPDVGVAHDAAFADTRPPGLELRLDQQDELGGGGREAEKVRRDGAQRDERDVDDAEVGRGGSICVELDVAHVGALQHRDAIVGAQRPRELAAPDVERDHVVGAPLQQAVGETAGRRPDVETAPALHVERERVERGRELQAASRDELGRRARQR